MGPAFAAGPRAGDVGARTLNRLPHLMIVLLVAWLAVTVGFGVFANHTVTGADRR